MRRLFLTVLSVLAASAALPAYALAAEAGAFAETAAVFLAEAPGATDPRSLTPGAPRTFEFGLRLSF